MLTKLTQGLLLGAAVLLLMASPSRAAEVWPAINCGQSIVQITPERTCRQAPSEQRYGAYCKLENDTAMYEGPGQFDYVRVTTPEANYNTSCYMMPDPGFASQIKTELPRLRRAGNWSAPTPFGTQGEEVTFTMPERNCVAFITMESRYNAGYRYQLHGLVCGAVNHAPLTQATVQQFVSSIRLR